MRKEVIGPAISLIVSLVLATYTVVSVHPYFVFMPGDVEIKDYVKLKFDIYSLGIRGRSGYDHVVGAILKNDTLGVTYYFESEECSDGISIKFKLNPPQDWSIYDYMIIDVFGDNSSNTLQFWYKDVVTGRKINIGQVTLNWFGWRRLSFYLLPVYERNSVGEFSIVILHENLTEEGKKYTLYVSSPILLENLKGKLNIVYGGWTDHDKINVEVYKDGEVEMKYRFTSPNSYSVKVVRIFEPYKDLSEFSAIKVLVYGDGSNNTLEFWYTDVTIGHSVNIGQVVLNWKGWKELTFTLPHARREYVNKFSVVIVYGEAYKQFSEEIGKNVASSGTVRIKELQFTKIPGIPYKILPVLVYLILFIFLKLPVSNMFSTSAVYLLLALPLRIGGYTVLANDFAQIAYYFIVIGTLSLILHIVYLRILKRDVEIINGEIVEFDFLEKSYILKIRADVSTTLLLKKPYDPHWKLRVYQSGQLVERARAVPYRGINAFEIKKKGELEVVIRYED